MKKSLFAMVLLILQSASLVRAQDIHFAQIYETPLFINPANAGFYNGYVRAIANYRNQWAAMNNAFQTMAISVDGGVFKSKKRTAFMGIGFSLFNDQAGVAKLSRTSALLNVSGIIKTSKNGALSIGLAGGTIGTNANYSNLVYESQFNGNTFDPFAVSGETPYRQYTTVDVGAGIAYEYTRVKRDPDHDDVAQVKFSFAAFHLNRPAQEYGAGSSYRLPVRYTAAIMSNIDLEDTKFTITPTVLYHMQGSFSEIYMGSFVKFRMNTGTKVTGTKTQNAIGFGLFYRTKDALIPKLIFDFGDLSIGMAYEANLSQFRTATNGFGGFEVSLRYNDLASALFETRKENR